MCYLKAKGDQLKVMSGYLAASKEAHRLYAYILKCVFLVIIQKSIYTSLPGSRRKRMGCIYSHRLSHNA